MKAWIDNDITLCVSDAVKEVSEQSRELLSQALEEAQAELSRKMELIRQIRAFESIPLIRQKFVDETEVSGVFPPSAQK